MITCQGSAGRQNFMSDWLNHVQGATRLLQLRGTEQMDFPAGLALFTLVRTQIVCADTTRYPFTEPFANRRFIQAFSNIFCRRRSSPEISNLSLVAKVHRDSDSRLIEDFYGILERLADLSIESDKIFTGEYNSTDAVRIIQEGLQLDADLVSWAESMNPTWRYKIVQTPIITKTNNLGPYSFYHSDKYYIYPDIEIASMWNNYHKTRIIVHGIVRSMCTQLLESGTTYAYQQTLLQSNAVSKDIIDNLCASVPYYFTSGETGVGGLMRLSWPLFIAADYSAPTSVERGWLVRTLEEIGRITGVEQALTMARRLGKGCFVPFIPGNVGRKRYSF